MAKNASGTAHRDYVARLVAIDDERKQAIEAAKEAKADLKKEIKAAFDAVGVDWNDVVAGAKAARPKTSIEARRRALDDEEALRDFLGEIDVGV